jgi:kinesin family member 12
MIACISPSEVYLEETLSTLNYATRTMNIKNKPVIQMDAKEQIIFNLKREIQLLKMENEYLKEKIYMYSYLLRIINIIGSTVEIR